MKFMKFSDDGYKRVAISLRVFLSTSFACKSGKA